jgi:hypothetical protein
VPRPLLHPHREAGRRGTAAAAGGVESGGGVAG